MLYQINALKPRSSKVTPMALCGMNDKMLEGNKEFQEGLVRKVMDMPLCGFNEKMIKGTKKFNEGLVEHGLVYRGKKNGETIDQSIKREISDMARLRPELYKISDTPKRMLTGGILTYAMGFYLVMRQKGLAENPEKYKRFISDVNNYFEKMDEKYYGELEGKADDMRLLAEFLDKLQI